MGNKEPHQEEEVDFPYDWSEWDLKTKYQIAFADMIEQRTTMMKFLIDNYGIEACMKFFLEQNPEWSEKLKIGKLKKIFAKMLAKLVPKMLLIKLSDIIISNAQYLIGLEHISIQETTNSHRIIKITKCPVKKQFKKTIKTLKFSDLEERYICTFACIPVLKQMCAVGNCNLRAEYLDKERGCYLIVSLKTKESELLDQSKNDSLTILKDIPTQ
ncbi:MAG: hypothetical protein ACFFD2_20290 [Promethearchaeota archaeon]